MKDKKQTSKKGYFLIGLTGGIGAGKSLVLKFLKQKKVSVLQTDFIGHQLLKEEKIRKIIVKKFGEALLDYRGEIDRKKLGQIVFNDLRNQRVLNEIMHPAIRKKVADWVKIQSKTLPGSSVLVVEVPLIFERGYYRAFDGVISVSSPKALRRKRLLKRGWSLAEIHRREKSQWSQTRKNRKADWVIFNQRSQKDLKYAVGQWFDQFQ